MPELYIIAGSNGAGKSTFAHEFLPRFVKCQRFINADLIAAGLSPFDPVRVRLKAGRLLIEEMKELIAQKQNFALESTLAGKTYIPFLKTARKAGFSIHIFFLWIAHVHLAKKRILQRVQTGGHDVPEQDIERRFIRGLNNFFNTYRHLADSWIIYDNSSATPQPIARQSNNHLIITNKALYQNLGEIHAGKR